MVQLHINDRYDPGRDFYALLLALVLHGLFAVAIVFWPVQKKVGPTVAARQISAAEFSANRRVLTPAQMERRKQLEQEVKKKKDEAEQKKLDQLKGQIVDLPASPDNRAPDDARFLSEFNTKVKKESKSRFRTQDYKRAANEVSQHADNAKAEQSSPAAAGTAGDGGKAQEAKTGKLAALETPRAVKRDRLELSLDPNLGSMANQSATEAKEGNSNRFRVEQGEEAQEQESGGGQNQAIKIPNMGVLAKLSGAPANDHLPDEIADGDGTFLNSREFKFAPFFNRMKQTVSEHWRPVEELRKRDPTMNIYGGQTRITMVDVVLAADGALKSIGVQKSCGLDFLDQEAMAAFQRAQPFPNPPKQLVKNGMVEFSFGFYFEFNARMF